MPNNGIVSKKTNIPTEFRASSISEFNNITDMVVISKPTTGINVEQKSVTLNQLAGLVGGGEAGPQGIQGPQGPAGPAVPSGLDWKGGYNSGLTYELNDVVTFLNPDTNLIGSYWVTVATITGTPPTDEEGIINTGWAFLASQGAQGIQGIQGVQGEVGPQGPAGTVTFPYKENISRISFIGGTVSLSQGFSTLTGSINGSRLNAGQYRFQFTSGLDFNGDLSKIFFDFRMNSNITTYISTSATSGINSIDVYIYEYVDGQIYPIDPIDQATLYYRKYN
jgi:hypothetical protein